MVEIPKHIAVIMDGNGRWAMDKGLPRYAGHREGANRLKEVVREAKKIGVKALTAFAFSTENWNRPKKEIDFLFSHMVKFLNNYKNEFIEKGIKFQAIGRRDRLSREVLKAIKNVEEATKNNKSFTFSVAIDYGGRWDIVNAARNITLDCQKKKISAMDINEDLFNSYMSLSNVVKPDLLIRTSGECRVSNFLIWDLAYSEFYFTEIYWPDFDKKELHRAIKAYSTRERRFGVIHD